jgi:hypothetical protein|tara:strand:- start:598 stop:894 length:297 start_codon:yes stop_codon:yes gene_type:complete
MTRNLVLPEFPVPPQEYEARYIAEIVRAFSVFLQQAQNPGEGRDTALTLTALQTDDVGLETGAVFNHTNYIKITVLPNPHPRGSAATVSVGSVTVSTS